MSGLERSIKVISVDGNATNFMVWKAQFKAGGHKKGYSFLLVPQSATVFVPKVHEVGKAFQKSITDDEGNVTTITKITPTDIMKLNLNAISDLLLSMEGNSSLGRVAFDIIRSTICPEYTNGNAQIAWLRLEMKYAPSTTFALSTLYKKYNTSRLKKG
jgi:ABC-type Fe3+-hydroxamate transport system substrate-binding protein